MAKWNEYGLKTGTSARDEVLILDSDTNTNKRITVGDIQEFANGKMLEKENSTLSTEAKTLIGAINEVDAKNNAQDESLEAIEKKFSSYVKKTDVDSTLSVAGSPADAKVVGERFKSNEKAIAELADKKITKFYASSQGNTHLPDSDEGKIQDMFLYGKSEQKQYKGKNLLNGNVLNETKNGITIKTNVDRTYVLNGTATDDAVFLVKGNIRNIFEKYEQLKLIGFDKKNPFNNMRLQCYVKGTPLYYDRGDGVIIQKPETDDNNIAIYVYKGSTLTNVIFKPMLTSDLSATIDDFESYVGGIPSPNPEYPQEIKAVVNPKVVVRGKNLLKATRRTRTINGVTFTNNGDGTYTVNGTATSRADFFAIGIYDDDIKIPLKQTKKYIFKGTGTSDVQIHAGTRSKVFASVNGKEFLLTNIAGLSFVIIRVESGITVNNLVVYLQVEEGHISTSYEPYTEQSVTLPYTLNAIPVKTGGNVTIDGQQYVADYVDVERGKLVRKVYKYSLTDIKELYTHGVNKVNGITGFYVYTDKENIPKIGGRNAISPFFTYNQSSWGGQQLGMSLVDTESYITITVSTDILENSSSNVNAVTSFKKFCKENDVFLNYQLATPEEIDLTPEQIQAYKSLSTNYPVTNIEVSSEQLDGYTVFNYPISMADGWNYVKQQLNDNRDYIYDMDLQSAEAYVNSEYAVALTELEVM